MTARRDFVSSAVAGRAMFGRMVTCPLASKASAWRVLAAVASLTVLYSKTEDRVTRQQVADLAAMKDVSKVGKILNRLATEGVIGWDSKPGPGLSTVSVTPEKFGVPVDPENGEEFGVDLAGVQGRSEPILGVCGTPVSGEYSGETSGEALNSQSKIETYITTKLLKVVNERDHSNVTSWLSAVIRSHGSILTAEVVTNAARTTYWSDLRSALDADLYLCQERKPKEACPDCGDRGVIYDHDADRAKNCACKVRRTA